ncbi:hypothetical protein F5H01DRAFT_367265 [Linnemannia elongata]|nr:hypothetical protein F5H01DRAFT_367265 [Linnemannia elongata]
MTADLKPRRHCLATTSFSKQRTGTIPPFPTSIFVYLATIKWLLETRYLAPRVPIPFSIELRDNVLNEYNSDRFRSLRFTNICGGLKQLLQEAPRSLN